MRFIHIADIHASRERLLQTLHILSTLTERAKQGDIDFILFAGDFWDSTITATKGSGFSDIISAVRELEKHTYLYFIYGTPTHEPSGSLDAFASDKVKIISKMSNIAEIIPINRENWKLDIPEVNLCNFVFIPEPRRCNYVGNSISETDSAINEDIKKFIKSCSKENHCIVVYHGEIKGAVYQNGVSASSPTAIPKELLQSLNADYYALGHIHLPQEVFKNAWYSGSACPKDFGETHDGHYNLVTIENGKTEVEQISFGLPLWVTYKVNYPIQIKGNWDNYHVRIQFDCTKEERKTLNIKELADSIKEQTKAISIKLEPNVIEGEAIQTSEVSKRKSIVEKMTAYAKEKGLKIPKYAKDLLQNIQDGTLGKLAFPQHSFELLSLSLRGAIGIRDGQGKENIELDFEKYEDGVICLVGHNGAGKSTLVENCHPYPKMLSRKGTLQDHFYLKDSHRILIYKDENGLYYKISMLIDGKTANGKVSYFVETSKDREVWKSLPDIDGSSDAYKEWVNNTFGSIDVYLRTAFFAKEQTKDATDISDTTKSERMEFLSKLAGTDQLKEVSNIAKELRKEVEKSADKIETEIDSYSRYEDIINQNVQDIKSWNNELKAQEKSISILEKEVEELKAKDSEYQKSKALSEANNTLYNQYKKEFDEKKDECDMFEEAAEHEDLYKAVAYNNEVISRNKPLIEQKEKELSDKRKEFDEVTEQITLYKENISQIQVMLSKLESEYTVLSSQIADVSEVCPTCGAPLSEYKKAELEKHVRDTEKKRNGISFTIKTYKENIKYQEQKLKEVDVSFSLKKEISALETDIQKLIDENHKANKPIENLTNEYFEYTYDEVCKETERLEKELDDLQSKMDGLVDIGTVEDVSEQLRKSEDKLKREINLKTELTASIKAAKKENERYQKELLSVEDKKKELKTLNEKITAYNFIEEAFSNKGIPALELRESAPEIAEIANKILKDSYGNKFEIRFGSTSELKAKRKADEDFNIIVTDTENFDEKTIDLVSSGERIWIKQALFYAFSIVQMNRTGFNFRTRLIDESDGSLDGGLRPKYLKMVEAAHKISDSRITVLITHSQEIKDIAQQIIEI